MATSFRVKTGCLTCRQRRKKCDERKPNCTGCTRNFLNCQWPKPVESGNGPQTKKATRIKDSHCKTTVSNSTTQHTVFTVERYRTSTETKPAISTEVAVQSCGSKELGQGSLTLWRSLTASFTSPDRAILLTPSSFLLLQHYLEDTGTFLVPKPRTQNPFITHVLPLAYSDDLLMHAVLTLSGIHLSYQKIGDLEIQQATQTHYSSLLRGLRLAFADPATQEDCKRILRLLLILVILCHAEAISGEPHGGIFPHLRASRQLILNLLNNPDVNMDSDCKWMKGFALEVYTYLVIANNITPYGRNEARTIPFDPFITSFELIREYETFGVFFSCGQGLFETIPRICMFAMNRLVEEERSGRCSLESQHTYDILISELLEWKSPPVDPEMTEWEQAHVSAGEVYRQALLIFVKTAMCGSVVDNPKVITEIQGHIETIHDVFPPVHVSPFNTVMLWPMMIMGSCTTSPRVRAELLSSLKASSIEVMQVKEAANLLQRLWEDEDKRAFGPFGLHLIMQKHNINFSMA